MRRYYPSRALFVTEFGAEANRSGPVDEKGTYEYQRDFFQFHLRQYDSKPYLNGAIAWLLRDYRVRPGWAGGNPKPNPPVGHKGIVEEDGEKKPAFGEVARMFQNLEPLP